MNKKSGILALLVSLSLVNTMKAGLEELIGSAPAAFVAANVTSMCTGLTALIGYRNGQKINALDKSLNEMKAVSNCQSKESAGMFSFLAQKTKENSEKIDELRNDVSELKHNLNGLRSEVRTEFAEQKQQFVVLQSLLSMLVVNTGGSKDAVQEAIQKTRINRQTIETQTEDIFYVAARNIEPSLLKTKSGTIITTRRTSIPAKTYSDFHKNGDGTIVSFRTLK